MLRQLFKKLQSYCLPPSTFPRALLQDDFVQALAKAYDSLLLSDYDKHDLLSTLLELLFLIEDISEHSEGKLLFGKVFIPRVLALATLRGNALKLQRAVVETLCGLITRSTENQQAVLSSVLDCYKLFKVFLPKCGDFHLQASIAEVLYRLSRRDVQLLDLLHDTDLKSAIVKLHRDKKPNLVPELRKFVNRLNESSGSLRSVHSFLAEKIVVNGHAATSEDKWVDFGSRHVSCYVFKDDKEEACVCDLLYQDFITIHRLSATVLEIAVREKSSKPYFRQEYADDVGQSTIQLFFSPEDLSDIISNAVPKMRGLKGQDFKLIADEQSCRSFVKSPVKNPHRNAVRKVSVGLRIPRLRTVGVAPPVPQTLVNGAAECLCTHNGNNNIVDVNYNNSKKGDERQPLNMEKRLETNDKIEQCLTLENEIHMEHDKLDVVCSRDIVMGNNLNRKNDAHIVEKTQETCEITEQCASMATKIQMNDKMVQVQNPVEYMAQRGVQVIDCNLPTPTLETSPDIAAILRENDLMSKQEGALEKNTDDLFPTHPGSVKMLVVNLKKEIISPYDFDHDSLSTIRERPLEEFEFPDLMNTKTKFSYGSKHTRLSSISPGHASKPERLNGETPVVRQQIPLPDTKAFPAKASENHASLNHKEVISPERCKEARKNPRTLLTPETDGFHFQGLRNKRRNGQVSDRSVPDVFLFQGNKRCNSGVSDPIETESEKHPNLLAKPFTPKAQQKVTLVRRRPKKQKEPQGQKQRDQPGRSNPIETTSKLLKIASKGNPGCFSNMKFCSPLRSNLNSPHTVVTNGQTICSSLSGLRNTPSAHQQSTLNTTLPLEDQENKAAGPHRRRLVDSFMCFSPLPSLPESPGLSESSGEESPKRADLGDKERSPPFEMEETECVSPQAKTFKAEGSVSSPESLRCARKGRRQRISKTISNTLLSPLSNQQRVAAETESVFPAVVSDEEGNECREAEEVKLYEDSSVEGTCKLIKRLLQKFKQKINVQVQAKMNQILNETLEKTLAEVQAVKNRNQDDTTELSKVCTHKFRNLESQLRDQKAKFEELCKRYQNEWETLHRRWNDLISQTESTEIELKGLADRQKITQKKLLAHTQEMSEQHIAEAEKKLSKLNKAGQRMRGLQELLKEIFEQL